mmetsp:Transcript_29255/g.72085  ORF Transcript_29255/g.72085 Transcript_29255/m.72085 type:complete len:233 (-) Transcript_29255:127-825(-)
MRRAGLQVQGHPVEPPRGAQAQRRTSARTAASGRFSATRRAAGTEPPSRSASRCIKARTAGSGRMCATRPIDRTGLLSRATSRCTSARTAERAAARVRRARLRVQGYDYKASRASSLATHRRRVCGEGGVARVVRLRTASPAASTGLLGRVTPLRTRARTERRHAVARDDPGCEYKASRASSLPTHWCTHSAGQLHARGEPGCEHRATRAGHFTAHKRTHSGDRSNEIGCDG